MSTKGISLHFGLNRIDPAAYGTNGALRGCENDARSMQSIARENGYEARLFLNEEATSDRFLGSILKAGQELVRGDTLLVTYAGHGAQVANSGSDREDDGRDETFCLFDRMVLDDEVQEAWRRLPAGVRVVFLTDSCHSGTAVRDLLLLLEPVTRDLDLDSVEVLPRGLTPEQAAQAARLQRVTLKRVRSLSRSTRAAGEPSGVLLAACQDHQTAGDGKEHGVFTEKLLDVWSDGAFEGSLQSFFDRIGRLMPPGQVPNLDPFGALDPALLSARPFAISRAPSTPLKQAALGVDDYVYTWRESAEQIAEATDSRRMVFRLDLPKYILEQEDPVEVFRVLSTEGVDVMMRCFVQAQAIRNATRAPRGFELHGSVNDKGEVQVGGRLDFRF